MQREPYRLQATEYFMIFVISDKYVGYLDPDAIERNLESARVARLNSEILALTRKPESDTLVVQ